MRAAHLACGLALLAAVMLLGACGDDADSGAEEGPIVIGFATAESGAFAAYDVPAVQGAQLKIDELNRAGGLDGRRIKVVKGDTKTDIDEAQIAANKVLSEGAEFVMVTCDFDYGAPSVLEAEKQGVVAMSSCAGSTKFRPAEFGPLAFSMAVATPAEGAAMAEFASERLDASTAYVLLDPSIDQTKQSAAAFTARWRSLGNEIVGEDTFQQDDQSISAQITRLRGLDQQPDVIYISSYPPGGPKAIRQLRAAGIESTILGDSNWSGSYWYRAVPGLSNMYHDAYVALNGDDPNARVNKLIERFEKRFGNPPDTSLGFITGYSTIEAFARAYRKAGTTGGEELAAALESFDDEDLLIGSTTFTEESHITASRPLRIIEIEDGTDRFATEWTAEEIPQID